MSLFAEENAAVPEPMTEPREDDAAEEEPEKANVLFDLFAEPEAPEELEEPEELEAPEEFEEPEELEAPEAPSEIDIFTSPEESETFDLFAEPEVTEEPEATDLFAEPEVTEEPEAADIFVEPEVTEESEITDLFAEPEIAAEPDEAEPFDFFFLWLWSVVHVQARTRIFPSYPKKEWRWRKKAPRQMAEWRLPIAR